MSEIARIHPYLFNLAESVRCRFEMGVCLSLYPNPAREGENVDATMRTQIFYQGSYVCLVRNYNEFVDKCPIDKESCKITFKAEPGKYYAFIDVYDCEHNLIPSDKQAKSKDTELMTLPLAIRGR